MQETDNTSIPAALINRLVEIFSPRRIVLFGSRARRDASPESDFDLMVLVPDEAPVSNRETARVYDCLWELGIAADVLVWTESRYQRKVHIKASLPATIEREGEVVYAA